MGSDNGLLTDRWLYITQTNASLLPLGLLEIKFCEILMKKRINAFANLYLKSHEPNQYLPTPSWTIRNKVMWNPYQSRNMCIREDAFEISSE